MEGTDMDRRPDGGRYWREQAGVMGFEPVALREEHDDREDRADDEETTSFVEEAWTEVDAAEAAGEPMAEEAIDALIARAEERDAAAARVSARVSARRASSAHWRDELAGLAGPGLVASMLGEAA
jgi:hypothetical protein